MNFQNREVRAGVEWINGQELQVNSSSELLANDMVEATFEAPGLASGINVWIQITNRVLEPGETLRYITHIVRMEDSEREVLDRWLNAQATAAPSKPRAEFETPSIQDLPPQNVKPSGTPSYLDAMRQRRKARSPVTPNRSTPATHPPSAPPVEKEDFFPPAPPAARKPSVPPVPRPTPIQIPVPDFFPSAPKAAEPPPPPAENEDFFPPPPPFFSWYHHRRYSRGVTPLTFLSLRALRLSTLMKPSEVLSLKPPEVWKFEKFESLKRLKRLEV